MGAVTFFGHLLNKFSRYWFLGVLTNRWSVVYALIGGLFAGFSYYPISRVATISHLQSEHPLISWLAEFGLLLVAPSLWPRRRVPTGAAQSMSLQVKSSSNLFLATVEELISDSVDNRRHREALAFANRYDWNTIQEARRRALLEEKGRGQFPREEIKREIDAIKRRRPKVNQKSGIDEKYEAIYNTLTYCKYRRFRHFLKGLEKGEAI